MRSACARVARTAGPLELLRMRNWMPPSSVAIAIAPPSASTSLTRCPLPIPPIDGLQLICPSVSMLCVSSSGLQPMRADATAASAPAVDDLICAALRGENPSWPRDAGAAQGDTLLERAEFHGVGVLLHSQ